MLLSPDEEEVTKIKHISSSILNNYPYDPVFYDITTTGRKMWISIYFTTRVDTMSFTELEVAKSRIKKLLFKKNMKIVLWNLFPMF